MGPDATRSATVPGYAGRPTTKAPNWHGPVTLDLLFNSLSTGLFLVTALGELVAPASFRPLAPVAYPIALLFLVADLACLVVDLGDWSRFHHMLRVWKPSSPMSLGSWALTAYSVPLTLLVLLDLLHAGGGGAEGLRLVLLVLGLVLAVAVAAYKGVLFSTTAQRGWGDARWLGGYLINSALVLGAAEALLIAVAKDQPAAAAALRVALRLLLLLNLVALVLLLGDIRGPLARARHRGMLVLIGALALLGGILVPLVLLGVDRPAALTAALLLILLGAVIVRLEMVRLPHALGQAAGGG
ncbi:MAG TPA: NrfD/PsrC family molybdoenzyme membrane anchor subunit [Gemmatimonadales bacterium]|nr:NrfD/PsrC family molybdoenzyme membrane anchor subunit [Gemmatimonadales bacterium]